MGLSMNLGNPQKAIDERVIINFCDKNVVIAHFCGKNGGFIPFIYTCIYFYKLERKLKESLLEVNKFGNIFRHLGFISYKLELRRQNSYPVSSVPK